MRTMINTLAVIFFSVITETTKYKLDAFEDYDDIVIIMTRMIIVK